MAIETSVATDIKDILIADGLVGTFGGLDQWAVHVAFEPDLPHDCVTLYDNQAPIDSRNVTSGFVYEREALQVRTRSLVYTDGYAKLRELMLAIDGIVHRKIRDGDSDEVTILGCHREQSPWPLGRDEKKRFMFSVNYVVRRK